jgi:predicted transcriptional regulator/KaiC/GvpD/RAD55 family RecA-like ATPase
MQTTEHQQQATELDHQTAWELRADEPDTEAEHVQEEDLHHSDTRTRGTLGDDLEEDEVVFGSEQPTSEEKVDPEPDEEATQAEEEEARTETEEPPEPDLSSLIMPWEVYAEKKFPPIETYLDPWVQSESIIMVSGSRGAGKSLFIMTLLDALTRGGKFGEWEVLKTVPVLWYEGEMASGLTQQRIRQTLQNSKGRNELALILNRAQLIREGKKSGLISDEYFRDRLLTEILNAGIKVVAFDNLSCLTSDLDENSKKEFDPVNQWLLELRALRLTVIFVHHTGKERKDQRGTSSHEDAIDFSILLEPKGKDGEANFDVKFSKNRSIGTRADLRKIFPPRRMTFRGEDGEYGWSTAIEKEEETLRTVLGALADKKSKETIQKNTGLSQKKLNEVIAELEKRGYILGNQSKVGAAAVYPLTDKGKQYLEEGFLGSDAEEELEEEA